MSDRRTSRYLCLILRHKPEVIGITLDEHGWADVEALIEGVSRTHDLDREILERIVAEDEKGRYSFNEDHTKIRANQGHSVPVDVELEEDPLSRDRGEVCGLHRPAGTDPENETVRASQRRLRHRREGGTAPRKARGVHRGQ